jgi:hypothetical protein
MGTVQLLFAVVVHAQALVSFKKYMPPPAEINSHRKEPTKAKLYYNNGADDKTLFSGKTLQHRMTFWN